MKENHGFGWFLTLFFVSFFVLPITSFAYTTINATISSSGVVSGFSVACATATSTNATAVLLHEGDQINANPYYYSIYNYMRRACVNGVATFDEFNLNQYVTSSGGNYPEWTMYFKTPFKLLVKDTTGLYSPDPEHREIINLHGAFNNYSYWVYGEDDTYYRTLGTGPSFTFDGMNWKIDGVNPPPPPVGFSNVLFIPGLEASRLYFDKTSCVLNCTDQLWEPNTNADIEDLYLNTDGTSQNNSIYTKDIIDETNTPIDTGFVGLNIYKSFIEEMNGLVQNEDIKEWRAYPYDWRRGVDEIVNTGTVYKNNLGELVSYNLIDTLGELASTSKSGKVTIITHSNGGLLAKALIKKLIDLKNVNQSNLIDKIDKIVFVAVPHIGTPSAIPAVLHGYDQTFGAGLILNEAHARELGKNMPGAYGLLPSKEYINHVAISPVTFSTTTRSGETYSYPLFSYYGNILENYPEYKNFLTGVDGRSAPSFSDIKNPLILETSLLNNSERLHDSLDNLVIPSNIKVTNIAGWGLDTIASFEYYPKLSCGADGTMCGFSLDERPLFTADGDGTVVTTSATYSEGQEWWVNIYEFNNQLFGLKIDRDHKNILEVGPLLNAIKNLIKDQELETGDVFRDTKPIDDSTRLTLSVHSPVEIGVYDSFGNFTGKVCYQNLDFCLKKEEIANSSYLEFGEGKYINVLDENYNKTLLTGTAIGTFDYVAEKHLPNGDIQKSGFYTIPVTSVTKAEVVKSSSNGIELRLDTNGDGLVDLNITEQNVFDPLVFLSVIRKTTEQLEISVSVKNSLLRKIDATINSIVSGKIKSAKTTSLSLSRYLERTVNNSKPKTKSGGLSKEDALVLLDSINRLLDYLNK